MANQALTTDATQMLSGANQMQHIADNVLQGLSKYLTMNQDLGGVGFGGDAYQASMNTTANVQNTGKQVQMRFQNVIDTIKSSAHKYQAMNDANRSNLSNISPA
jgi:hypothetical protein